MALRDQIKTLVVDDMSTSRGLITQAVDARGVRQIETLSNGAAARQKIATWPVHLVVSDKNMPQMNGMQLLRALRRQPQTRGVGFPLVTGKADRETIETGNRLGMNNILPKPFQPTDLRNAIEAIVGRL